uniref:Maturase K n=1 Tax=Buxbaumia aphylla TaxID=70128 RepID=A0A6C0M518_BUXAP|nr:maturase K [Buxbaumia aphylla]QHU77113.1 maturase K [Buxbaumia aphylla]
MAKLQRTETKFFWQQRFLYPLLFQDDLYAIAYNRFLNKINSKTIENFKLDENVSFLTLKRLISRLRQKKKLQELIKNYNKNFNCNYNSNFYLRAIREGVTIILEFSFFERLEKEKPFIKNFYELTNYQSIHSGFPFIEDKFLHSSYILNKKMPYFLHPELLIRIFRRRIQDASFLHSPRSIFHKNQILTLLDKNSFFYQKEITRLSFFLWHLFTSELESFLIDQCKKFNDFKSFSYLTLLNKTNCIKKFQNVINPLWIKLQIFFFYKKIYKKSVFFHYVRYENSFILSIKSSNYFVEKWKFFFFKFWQYYFCYLLKPYRIQIKKISKFFFSLLGYVFSIKIKTIMVRIKMLNNLSKANFINKQVYSITPKLSLLKILAKEKFCDNLGYPISKLTWTTLTDEVIFNRFNQIWKNFFHYYSGCINKKNLYQVQYILRFSCAKTLACKHKSTIRFVWKKHGSNFFAKSFFFKKQELICLKFYKIYPFIKKIWYLDIIQINFLANSLQEKDTNNK